MSGLLWWSSRSVWMVKSQNSFTSSFSYTLLGECSYHLSLHSTPYSSHNYQFMTHPATSCLFLYSVCASLGQLHKICCTVSSWLPHILHLDDTFWFSILVFMQFVLSAWSCAAKIIITIIIIIIITIIMISINTQVIIQNRALSLARYLGLSADNHLDGQNGCQ